MNDLTGLAVETGGTYEVGNDLGSVFQRVEKDASSSYLMAYYKHGLELDGRFHSLKVECKRHGVRVQTRSGYFAGVGGIRELAPVDQLRMLLAAQRPFEDVKIGLKPYFFPFSEGGKNAVVAALGIAFRWVPNGTGSGTEGVSVLGVIHGPENSSESILYEGRLEAVSRSELSGLTIRTTSAVSDPILLSAGATAIKVAARAETGELGNAFLECTVPEQSGLGIRMSSLVVARRTEPAPASENRRNPLDPLYVGDQRIIPQGFSSFEPTDELLFYARVAGTSGSQLGAVLSFQRASGQKILQPSTIDLPKKADESPFGSPVLFKVPASAFQWKDEPIVAVLAIKETDGKIVASASTPFLVQRKAD